MLSDGLVESTAFITLIFGPAVYDSSIQLPFSKGTVQGKDLCIVFEKLFQCMFYKTDWETSGNPSSPKRAGLNVLYNVLSFQQLIFFFEKVNTITYDVKWYLYEISHTLYMDFHFQQVINSHLMTSICIAKLRVQILIFFMTAMIMSNLYYRNKLLSYRSFIQLWFCRRRCHTV